MRFVPTPLHRALTPMRLLHSWFVALFVAGLLGPGTAPGARADQRPAAVDPAGTPANALAADLAPLWECLAGGRDSFSVAGTIAVVRNDARIEVNVRLERHDAASFDVAAEHDEAAFVLRRRADATALALPRHKVAYVGRGATDPTDHLEPGALAARLISPASQAAAAVPFLGQSTPAAVAGLLCSLLGVKHDPADDRWERAGGWLDFDDAGRRITADVEPITVDLTVGEPDTCPAVDDFPGHELRDLPRDELERTLCRGVRRGLEILLPGPELVSPAEEARRRTASSDARSRRCD
ncbi:MAG: hypothetical protein DWI27_01255 [Planctomycetota bacterium]|nr:MAG: hypothetical protein DWI27_01255 [Planctomycetota bacterium]